ncbi:methyltransferase [Streptomyces sp. NPDC021224]|uniref:methyltransferase n=1 Tax=unclassified Streptomyces TaxID=2593676 RepID=UPI003796EEED
MPSEQDAALDRVLHARLYGYRQTQLIHLMVRLGIADALADGPRTAADLARRAGADPETLADLLRVLADEDLLAPSAPGSAAPSEPLGTAYRLTPLGARLRDGTDSGPRGWAVHVAEEQYRAWGESLAALRSGRSGFEHAYGQPFWAHLARHPHKARSFDEAMVASSAAGADAIAGSGEFPARGPGTVVDVGGGTGAVLTAVLRAHPALTGVLYDNSPVVAEAAARLRAAGVLERCTVRPGSFLSGVPAGGNVYLLCRVLCDWADAEALRILRNCRAAMGHGARLLIAARLTDDPRLPPNPMFDLHFRLVSGGRDRSAAAYAALLRTAGLPLLARRPLDGTNLTLLVAAPG